MENKECDKCREVRPLSSFSLSSEECNFCHWKSLRNAHLKYCNRCEEEKDLSLFPPSLGSICRSCLQIVNQTRLLEPTKECYLCNRTFTESHFSLEVNHSALTLDVCLSCYKKGLAKDNLKHCHACTRLRNATTDFHQRAAKCKTCLSSERATRASRR
jgi:hypothetical protein